MDRSRRHSGRSVALVRHPPLLPSHTFEHRRVDVEVRVHVVDANRYEEDDLLPAIEAGALDVSLDDDVFEILTEPTDLQAVRAALEGAGVELESSELLQYPKTRVPIEEDTAGKLMRLIDALEDNDDVNEVHANFDVDASVLERVAG